jgi:hypothetical protein
LAKRGRGASGLHLRTSSADVGRPATPARELLVTEPGAYRFAIELSDLDRNLDSFDQLFERSGEPTTREAQRLFESGALVRSGVAHAQPAISLERFADVREC